MKGLLAVDAACRAPGVVPGAIDISISVVSHGQMALVADLMAGLASCCAHSRIELILTLNMEEPIPLDLDSFPYPVLLVRNHTPQGFGANQNRAFARASGRYFCVINPDIQIDSNPFPALLRCLSSASIGIVAPLVMAANGELEVTARRFPSPLKLFYKLIGRGWAQDYPIGAELICPDWVGGMFMLFPVGIYERLGGFDERYFLYYEDVDICARSKLLGYRVAACPDVRVTHNARRQSHHDFKYLSLHLRSIVRFFLSPAYWKIRFSRKPGTHDV